MNYWKFFLLSLIVFSSCAVNVDANTFLDIESTTTNTIIVSKPEEALDYFVSSFNQKNEDIHNFYDSNNSNLKINVDRYFKEMVLSYRTVDTITNSNTSFTYKTVITASGAGWSVSGFKVYFDVELVDGTYKVVDTDLFDHVGPENVSSFIFKIFRIVLYSFIGITLIIIIIVVVIVNKHKKNNLRELEQKIDKDQYTGL